MREYSLRVRILKDIAFRALVNLLSCCTIVPLLLILFYISKNGAKAVNWNFLTKLPAPVGETGGGIANAIVGTFILIVTSCSISIPLGVGAGIYLSERRTGRFSSLVRLCVEILQGIPSIVIGILAYAWVVITLGTFSALSGGVALGIMMLPIIVRATEETLKLIPHTLKEASLSLGVPYYRTLLQVIIPAGMSGILTGILVSVARVAGETAPLLFTAFGTPFMNVNLFKPINALPLLIFNYATSPYPEWHSLAWGASFVLILLVLFLNVAAKMVTKRWKVQF